MPHIRRVFVDLAPYIPEKAEVHTKTLASLKQGHVISLSSEDSHHLCNVLRLSHGEEIIVFDRSWSFAPVRAELRIEKDSASAVVIEEAPFEKSESIVKTVVFALSKGERNDLVCQKATELGVEHIVLWQAERSVVKINDDKTRTHKIERWEKIVEAASKQSGQSFIPRISIAVSVEELLKIFETTSNPGEPRFFCSLSSETKAIHEVLHHKQPVHLVIGPEGDLSPEEEKSFSQNGFVPITLGNSVLRSETAAIVAIAMVQAIWRAL